MADVERQSLSASSGPRPRAPPHICGQIRRGVSLLKWPVVSQKWTTGVRSRAAGLLPVPPTINWLLCNVARFPMQTTGLEEKRLMAGED